MEGVAIGPGYRLASSRKQCLAVEDPRRWEEILDVINPVRTFLHCALETLRHVLVGRSAQDNKALNLRNSKKGTFACQ